ncbi:MAG: amidohydrolase/deacetylase family metallohydrolase [Chloroflexi bacterium]|nr:amidohydrolase/deacetylase family metallohydrolase [Chloroflexota bacterium]
MHFDMVIAGGEVIDPGTGRIGRFDVGIRDGRIAAVDRALPTGQAAQVVDASGQFVTPGLVDLHTHVYWGATFWGIEPDPVAARTGVTTWLDVGSSGAYNFPGFRRWVVEPSQSRVYGLLNISSIGLTAPTYELANLDYADVALATTVIGQNRDVLVGVKARIDALTTRGTGIEPLRRAREAADRVGLPLMVHVGKGPPPLDEIISLMRPGDILTHCFTGHSNRVVDERGRILDYVKRAWEEGLILDIGHGSGSFSFATGEAMLAAGYKPDVISSDIHQLSIQGPMFDLPTTLSKFLALGMTVPEVIERATVRAARAMGKPELGTLAVGAVADVALFQLEPGNYTFHDVFMVPRSAKERLVNTRTLRAGQVMAPTLEQPLHTWAHR